MAIQEVREGDVLVLVPERSAFGRDEATAAEDKLTAAIKAGTRFVVLDCTAVTQLTSDATRVLLMTSRKLSRLDGRLVLCGMNAKLKKAFSVSGFNKDFTVVVTREEAVQRVVEPVERPVRVVVPQPPRPPRTERPAAQAVDEAPEADAPTVVGVTKMPAAAEAPTPDAPTVVGVGVTKVPVAVHEPASDAPTVVGVTKIPAAAEAVESDAATMVVATNVPTVDPREAIATALFDALGVDVSRRGPEHYGSAARRDADMAASLLAALGADAP